MTFSNDFDLVVDVVNTLTDDMRREICNGTFGDSPYVIYREVLVIDDGTPVSFIDLYQTPEMSDVAVVIARRNEEDCIGKGYASILVERAIETANAKGWNLVWPVNDHNAKSKAMATRYGIPMEVHQR